MRRLHQVFFGGMGGQASMAVTLATALRQHHHSFTLYGNVAPHAGVLEWASAHDARVFDVRKRVGLDLSALRAVHEALQASQPDVVVMHSLTTLPAVLPYVRARRVPLIAVDHTAAAAKARHDWVALALALRVADRVVFLTHDFAERAQRQLGPLCAPHRYDVIANGVDITRFAPATSPLATRTTMCMLARFTPVRDHATLVQAINLLREDPKLKSWRWVLAGDGPTLAEVQTLVAKVGLERVVSTPGALDDHQVLEVLHDSYAYVQASLADNMSMSVMQAMACGLPVVASDIDGMRTLVDPERTGLLVEKSNPAALAAALRRLAYDEAFAQQLGITARAAAVEQLSDRRMATNYEQLFDEVLRR